MAAKHRKRRASPKGPGWTISEFAALPEVNATSAVIRSAVKNGEIEAIPFNRVLRIPPREKERYVATWGVPAYSPTAGAPLEPTPLVDEKAPRELSE